MNVWRGAPARILSWLLLLTVFVAVSCNDDDDAVADVTVNFDTASQSLRESDEAVAISMKLSGAASRDGNLTFGIESTAVYGTDYTTNPTATDNKIVVPVIKGQTAVKFTIVPVDNSTLSGDRTIKFTLAQADAGFKIGEKVTETITLIDDEGPSKANFAAGEGTLSSDQTAGQKVTISFSSKLPSAGTLKVTIASATATYGTQFTTTPAATDNAIELPVATGATETSFTIVPGTVTASTDITFTLTSPSGGVELGTQTVYKLTLTPANIISVTDLRALYTGATTTVSVDKALVGTVISSAANLTNKNLWLHDGTKGILIRFDNAHSFVAGDKISVQVKGVLLGMYQGVIELGVNTDTKLADAKKLGAGTLPTYKTITIDDLKTGNYEGDLVKIENVHFTNADGSTVLNGGSNTGNNTFADATGAKTAILRVESYAPFKGTTVPLGSGTLQGIANSGGSPANFQITPMAAEDIFASNSAGTLSVSETSLSFGDVANGSTSTAKTFTVSSVNLTGDVTVTASSGYTVSLSEVDGYASSVTITKANATACAVTVYVKFAPNSGSNVTITGTITVASTDVASKSVSVTGNETGNAPAAALLLEENFNYGGSDNVDIAAASSAAWATHSTASTGGPTAPEMNPDYSATGLTSAGYPGSGVGGAMAFTFGSSGTNDGDVNRKFSAVSADQTVYVSFLVNLASAKSADYFFHLGPNTIGNTFLSRVSARTNGTGWSFGLAKYTEAATTDATVLDFNKTYLVVLKYTFSTAATTDDVVSLYVYDGTIPTSEASANVASILSVGATKNDSPATNIGAVAVRQSSNSPTGKIDGIRVAQSWADLFK